MRPSGADAWCKHFPLSAAPRRQPATQTRLRASLRWLMWEPRQMDSERLPVSPREAPSVGTRFVGAVR